MSEDLFYNDIDILEKLRELGGAAEMTDFLSNIGSSITNNYTEQGSRRYGQSFMYNTFAVKQIPVTIKLIGMYDYFVRCQEWLGGLINQAKPAPLVRGLEPNKIWQAIPSGQSALAIDSSTSPPSATVTLTFDVPEVTARGKVLASVSTAGESKYGKIESLSNSSYKATLHNFGTAEAFPKITIKHNSENGYIGIVNASGVKAIGNEQETDTTSAQKSELLIDYRGNVAMTDFLARGIKNQAVNNDETAKMTGTLVIDNHFNRSNLHLTNSGGAYGASSVTFEIPADSQGVRGSLNDYIWWRQVFWCGSANQAGYMKITVSDTEGHFLYGVETIKRKLGTTESEYNVLVTDGKGGYRILDSYTFKATASNDDNPFNEGRGWSDIKRNDDRLRAFWWGSYPERVVPELKGKKSEKVHVTIGTLGNIDKVTYIFLDEFLYQKDFVSYTRDIPNAFASGSTVVFEMESDNVYVNNLKSNNKEIIGSEPISLSVGNDTIEFYFSSWLKSRPEIAIEWEERFI